MKNTEISASRYHEIKFAHDYAREIVAVSHAVKLKPDRVVAVVQALRREQLLAHPQYDHEAVDALVVERDELQVRLDESPDQETLNDLDRQVDELRMALDKIQDLLAGLDRVDHNPDDCVPEPALSRVIKDLRAAIEREISKVL